jgi:hypothetical protein
MAVIIIGVIISQIIGIPKAQITRITIPFVEFLIATVTALPLSVSCSLISLIAAELIDQITATTPIASPTI